MRILESLPWDEIREALGARALGTPTAPARGASIDTRTLERGDIFFALKGERVDGHEHLGAAIGNGAACVVIKDAGRSPDGVFALVVEDPEIALSDLARLIRSRSRARFVAITGSAGKTTAKDFTASLLSGAGPVLSTRGNLNNHLGVPLTLARIEDDHWAAVIECGMSHAGELSRLAHLIRPKVAAITNVAPAHLEFFASVDEIALAKAVMFETLRAGDTAVAPSSDPRLAEGPRAAGASVCLFGEGAQASIGAASVSMSLEGSEFTLRHGRSETAISLPVPGPHAIHNFLVAAAIAATLGLTAEVIAARARLLKSGDNRGAIKRLADDILVIDDSYNSNPKALLSAIETLALAKDRRRVACLGDMLELGGQGPRLHREAGEAIGPRVDLLLGVGPLGGEIVVGASALPSHARLTFHDSVELASRIGTLVRSHDAVLVKGSRGVRMERVVEALEAAHPGAAA